MALLQFLNGFNHDGLPHLVNLKSCSNRLEQGNGQPSTQMFAEFFQTLEHHQVALRIHVEDLVREQLEAESTDHLKNALRACLLQKAHPP